MATEQQRQHPVIAGLGIDPARTAAVAAASALPVGQAPVAEPWATAGPVPVLLLCAANRVPTRTLAPPVRAVLEDDGCDPATMAARIRRALAVELFISVSTRTAHSWPLAQLVCATLVQRGAGPADPDGLATALQESISNAVVHGNLGLPGMKDCALGDLERHAIAMANRLADTRYAERRVEVSLRLSEDSVRIEVQDEGDGFAPALTSGSRGGVAPSGRGLALIASFCQRWELRDGGRRLYMEFSR